MHLSCSSAFCSVRAPLLPVAVGPATVARSGSLFIARDLAGRETCYGKWRVGSEQIKRRIGPKLIPSTREGLTRTQAEAELRRMMSTLQQTSTIGGRITVAEGGALLIESITAKGRKRATITYESHIRVHLAPFFATKRLARIGRREIQAFVSHMTRTGRSTKTTFNALAVLHGIFELARREEWVLVNPCSLVDKPRSAETDPDIQFLDLEEVEALLRASPMTTPAASSARCTSRPP